MAEKTNADKLKARFHHLFRSAPQEFEAALFEYELYCEDVADAVVVADAGTILNIQGRIQQTRALLRILKECRDYKPHQPAPPANTP
jgi:hypothetical protein